MILDYALLCGDIIFTVKKLECKIVAPLINIEAKRYGCVGTEF